MRRFKNRRTNRTRRTARRVETPKYIRVQGQLYKLASSETDLDHLLEAHELWLEGKPEGKRFDASYKSLYRANLAGANLKNAYMKEATLVETNLKGANLEGAEMAQTYLGWANLENANLSGASLYKAEFENTNLLEADLSGANLDKVLDYGNSDFSGAIMPNGDYYDPDTNSLEDYV